MSGNAYIKCFGIHICSQMRVHTPYLACAVDGAHVSSRLQQMLSDEKTN